MSTAVPNVLNVPSQQGGEGPMMRLRLVPCTDRDVTGSSNAAKAIVVSVPLTSTVSEVHEQLLSRLAAGGETDSGATTRVTIFAEEAHIARRGADVEGTREVPLAVLPLSTVLGDLLSRSGNCVAEDAAEESLDLFYSTETERAFGCFEVLCALCCGACCGACCSCCGCCAPRERVVVVQQRADSMY